MITGSLQYIVTQHDSTGEAMRAWGPFPDAESAEGWVEDGGLPGADVRDGFAVMEMRTAPQWFERQAD